MFFLRGSGAHFAESRLVADRSLVGSTVVLARDLGPRLSSRFAMTEIKFRVAAGKAAWERMGYLGTSRTPRKLTTVAVQRVR